MANGEAQIDLTEALALFRKQHPLLDGHPDVLGLGVAFSAAGKILKVTISELAKERFERDVKLPKIFEMIVAEPEAQESAPGKKPGKRKAKAKKKAPLKGKGKKNKKEPVKEGRKEIFRVLLEIAPVLPGRAPERGRDRAAREKARQEAAKRQKEFMGAGHD